MTHPLSRLLRRNISAGQIAGYALANLVGLTIVLTALQFYRDVTSATSGSDSFISADYLIISKKVNGLGSFMATDRSATTFTTDERTDIASQPWASAVGAFTSADFNVAARVEFGGMPLSTALFLESIPDEFFDVSPRGWHYTPGSGKPLPIVISKDYLTLYNFGFATSRGMPQISEELIGSIPLRLSVSGGGKQEWIDARIVGFSSRLNTIAVPEEFMEWANREFADHSSPAPSAPSRLIVRLRQAGDPDAMAYMASHDYEVAGDKDAGGKAAYFLSLVTTIVVSVGIIISLLAFFILLLSIYLLLQKNREKIHDLMLLGYTPAQVAAYYNRLVATVNITVLLAAVTVMLAASWQWKSSLDSIGAEGTPPWLTIAVGTVIMTLITIGNMTAISRSIRRTFRTQQ